MCQSAFGGRKERSSSRAWMSNGAGGLVQVYAASAACRSCERNTTNAWISYVFGPGTRGSVTDQATHVTLMNSPSAGNREAIGPRSARTSAGVVAAAGSGFVVLGPQPATRA